MSTTMASAIFTPSHSCPPTRTSAICGHSTSVYTHSKTHNTRLLKSISQLGLIPLSEWSGLKHMGCSIVRRPVKRERKRLCRGKVVHASLFGVGAPEALVIGVVALLVFGPKGLAEVARNLGKTLRAFQPTIRELQDVSREFKSTLEREIGLDEIQSSTQNPYSSNVTRTTPPPTQKAGPVESQSGVDPNAASSSSKAYSSEDYLKVTEEQLKAIAAQQQTQTSPVSESQPEPLTQPNDTVQEASTTLPMEQKPENKA